MRRRLGLNQTRLSCSRAAWTSLAGVVDVVLGQGKRAALVSHHSADKVVARQKQLVATLREIAPGRLLHFPVLLRKRESLSKEYTLRSRSFVFASLAAAVGRMLGKHRILMCENGIVSLNLPIARQLVGARSSRTTHPKALACFGLLFEMLFGEPAYVENPFFWRTKAEVVKVIGDHGCSHLIASTISCSHVYQMSKEQPHCGECSQCIDRRFGVLGAGLETEDPEGQYRLKLLVDEWKAGEPRTLAESYIRFAVDARNASVEAFYARFAGEISRAVQSLPGDRDRNARQVVDTQKRHAASVFSILEREVARRASGLLDGSLPPYCLLRIAVSSHDQLRRTAEEVPIPADEPSARSDQPQRLRDGLGAPEIQIAVNEAAQRRARSRRSRIQGAQTTSSSGASWMPSKKISGIGRRRRTTATRARARSRRSFRSANRRCVSEFSGSGSACSIGSPKITRYRRMR